MVNKDIEIWKFFVEIMKHSGKLIFMDGDISQRTLKLASSFEEIKYGKEQS